jgi:hypothetical protein
MSDSDTSGPPSGLYDADEIRTRENAADLPEDLRDDIPSTADVFRPDDVPSEVIGDKDPDRDYGDAMALPDAAFGRNPRPDAVRQPTRDPNLSRAVDIEAAGGDPEERSGMSDGPTI